MMSDDRLEHFRRRYAAFRPGWEHATARFQRWVAQCVAQESRVLDVGCGRGGIVERLHSTGRWTGCDPDIDSLKEHRLPVLLRSQAHAEHLPYGSAIFDVVVASWVLEHLRDPVRTFAEVARVLRPGGHFFFLTPNQKHPIPYLSQRFARLAALQKTFVTHAYRRALADAFPVYYRANTVESIGQIATATGLRLVQMEFIADPSYFAWSSLTFGLAAGFEQLLPAMYQVHIIGEFVRSL